MRILSGFNYTFYSPAPPRYGSSFDYSMAVRYDLFGSALQAKLRTRVNQHIRVEYLDELGTPLKRAVNLKGITGTYYRINKEDIPNYSLANIEKDTGDINKPIIRFIYRRNPVVQVSSKSAANTISTHSRRPTREVSRRTANRSASVRRPVSRTQDNARRKSVKAKKDPFLENTGMNADEKKIFIEYLKAVEKNARKKYGNNRGKINHEIANALIYPVYEGDILQSNANKLKKPKVSEVMYDNVDNLLNAAYKKNNYLVDISHMACPLGSYESSNVRKEFVKFFTGMPYLVTRKDKFFYLNSYTGDFWTHMGKKDLRSDKDAIILKYHPKYKGKLYSRSIIDYYNQENLSEKRRSFLKKY